MKKYIVLVVLILIITSPYIIRKVHANNIQYTLDRINRKHDPAIDVKNTIKYKCSDNSEHEYQSSKRDEMLENSTCAHLEIAKLKNNLKKGKRL